MKKDWLEKWVGNWLKKDRDRANDVISYAFPGERLGKYRSDKGRKKYRPGGDGREYRKAGE